MKLGRKNRKELFCYNMHYLLYISLFVEFPVDLHGNLELCNPMSLCFFEGPEGGIGITLGKAPKKLRGEFR